MREFTKRHVRTALVVSGLIGATSAGVSMALPTAAASTATRHHTGTQLVRKAGVLTVDLALVQNRSNTPSSATPIVPAPVPGKTNLSLPVYGNAVQTSQPFAMAFEETPASPYVRTGKSEFVVHATSELDVQNWYGRELTRFGYKESGTASSGNVRTGEKVSALIFQPKQQPLGHRIEIDLSFEPLSGSRVLIEYFATDLVIPPRPSSTLLPANVFRVTGDATIYGSKVTHVAVNIGNPSEVAKLVGQINALTQVVAGENPGGPNIWAEATLHFITTSGKTIDVHLDPYGVALDGVGLNDYQSTVWNAFQAMIGVHGPN